MKPPQSSRAKACPFTTLYWDFLLRHETALTKNPRSVCKCASTTRLTPEQKTAIVEQAKRVRASCEPGAQT